MHLANIQAGLKVETGTTLVDGSGQVFIERERDKAVNCVCVVGGMDLWVGGAAGDLAVFALATGEKKVKPFIAHDKGVSAISAVREKFVVTGGADFQFRVWTLQCKVVGHSGHHHGRAWQTLPATSRHAIESSFIWFSGILRV